MHHHPHRQRLLFCGLIAGIFCAGVAGQGPSRNIADVKPDLKLPAVVSGQPLPGKRVRQTTTGFNGPYHTLYLPTDWSPERKHTVVVEFTSGTGGVNGVEDAKTGFGITAGLGCIWVVVPMVNAAGTANTTDGWWGDAPNHDPRATVEYCKATVAEVCRKWGGDADRVILVGYGSGAIACNYIGLYDDQIASLWHAFVCVCRYDGVSDFPGSDRAAAVHRLKRLGVRPQFILCESEQVLAEAQAHIRAANVRAPIQYSPTGFSDHGDNWILRPSEAREALRKWFTMCLYRKFKRTV